MGMTNREESAKPNWPRWQQVLLIAVLAVLIGSRLTSQVDAVAHRAGLFGEFPLIEATVANDPDAPAGFRKVVRVEPNSSAARAGTRIGDHLRVDSFFRDGRQISQRFSPEEHLTAGDWINFTRDREGIRSEYQIILKPVPAGHEQEYRNSLRMVNLLASIISSLIGCFVLWRGWGNTTAMLLGGALAVVGVGGFGIPPWVSNPVLENAMWWLVIVAPALVALLIPFAIRMLEQQGRALPRWHWRLASAWSIWCLVSVSALATDLLGATNFFNPDWRVGYRGQLASISLLVAIAYLVAGWRRAAAAERSRFALIIFALAAYLFTRLLLLLEQDPAGLNFGSTESAWLIIFNAVMVGIIAPGLLAYAVLRHKLFDLGFAVNRTLVFGAVGVLLLVSFALIEWAIKQAIPKVWYGGSVYISAGIAVGLYLTFNRLHHKVEHAIERVFFHKWQVNEAALKRFVAAAAHMEKPESLAPSFVAELTRFTGGAAVALYARTPEGKYSDKGGAAPIDADDLALAAMRAEQGPVVPAEVGSPIEAALALPMLHQAALAGFVLLGPKPSGEDYRPDEIEIMAWATHQVGLDLQAIRVRELELNNVKLMARNQALAEMVAGATLAKA
jgi:hypothetical protein